MKIHGEDIKGPNIEIIIIPRNDRDPIVFKAQAILDFDHFDKLCPRPKAPQRMERGKGLTSNPEDPKFKAQVEEWGNKRIDWMVITSLRATEGLEWEKVKYDNPDTWKFYKDEFKASGFSSFEVDKIMNGVMIANCLDEDKIEEARKIFLAGQVEAANKLSSRNGEPRSTLSGEPVRDSE